MNKIPWTGIWEETPWEFTWNITEEPTLNKLTLADNIRIQSGETIMTTPQVAYALAMIEASKARIEGIKAESEARLRQGEAPAYGEDAFFIEVDVLQQLAIQAIQG